MSEEEPQHSGPPMICATSALKIGPTRIGHIAGNITLPRTVAITTALACLAGGLAGLLFAAMIPTGGMQKFIFGAMFGGTAGWFLTTFSPLRDESLATWFGLQLNTMRKQRLIDGKPVVVAVGAAVVPRETSGKVTIRRSAVRVPAGRYDERGVLISAGNKNLPDGAVLFGTHVMPPTAHRVSAPDPDPGLGAPSQSGIPQPVAQPRAGASWPPVPATGPEPGPSVPAPTAGPYSSTPRTSTGPGPVSDDEARFGPRLGFRTPQDEER